MWLRDQLREIENHLIAFLQVTADRAKADIATPMPGYTRSALSLSDGLTGHTHAVQIPLEEVEDFVDVSGLHGLQTGRGSGGGKSVLRNLVGDG